MPAIKSFKVEGLLYDKPELALVVAERFARRYGRDIPVTDEKGEVLYLVPQSGVKPKRASKKG